jgi:hypothetical protein
MTRTRKMYVVLALLAGLVTWGAGVGASSAQEHHGDHGDHGHGGSSTTAAPTTAPTTAPPTTAPPTSGPSTTTPPTTPPPTTTPPTPTTAPPDGTPGAETSKVRYGPFTIPGSTNEDGSDHGHSHTGNRFSMNIQKPCTNCYLTGIEADLVYADGRRAGYSTAAQLHHMVLFNRDAGRTDATCGSSALGLLGQRFFASGDEREPVTFPNGFGYKIGANSQWNMIWDLAGMSEQAQDVFFELTYNYVPADRQGMTDVEPVWLDINQCGTSMYSAPAGASERTYTWTVNRPGRLVAIGGHQHDGGTHLTINNDSTNRLICDSRPTYGGEPLYVDHHGVEHLSGMSGCIGTGDRPVDTLTNGQRITIHSFYELEEAQDDVMGISVGYVASGTSGSGGGGGGGVEQPPGSSCPWWWPPCWFQQRDDSTPMPRARPS